MYISQSQHRLELGIWLKRLGYLGGLFFLLKGVVWLTLPFLLLYLG